MIRGVLVVLMLAACAPKLLPEVSFRDTTRPAYSIAGLDPVRIAGTWVQVAGFGAACSGGSIKIGAVSQYALCLPGGMKAGGGAMASAGQGRFDLSGVGPFWVLWADADDRTLVIGAPDGHYGLILNRDANIPVDRLTAARDILRFNGYDVTKLRLY